MDGGHLRRVLARISRRGLYPVAWIESCLSDQYFSFDGGVWSKLKGAKLLAPEVQFAADRKTPRLPAEMRLYKPEDLGRLILSYFVPLA